MFSIDHVYDQLVASFPFLSFLPFFLWLLLLGSREKVTSFAFAAGARRRYGIVRSSGILAKTAALSYSRRRFLFFSFDPLFLHVFSTDRDLHIVEMVPFSECWRLRV